MEYKVCAGNAYVPKRSHKDREMSPSVKCSPHKREILRSHVKKPGKVLCTRNPNTKGVEADRKVTGAYWAASLVKWVSPVSQDSS